MNRLDKEKEMKILKALLVPQESIYKLVKNLKETWVESNWSTVYRYIKNMSNQGLVRNNRTLDGRRTLKPELTLKGFATVLIDGDLQKQELASAVRKILQIDFSSLPSSFLMKISIDDIIANMLLRLKPKVNLKYFDEKYFVEVFVTSFMNSLEESAQKIENTEDKEIALKVLGEVLDALKKISEKRGFRQDLEDILNSPNLEDELEKRLALKGEKKGV